MLKHLHIKNYALISHLDIDFADGFSVLTGETGAGKSIILGALSLVMGSRADTKVITEGEDRCVIEAEFDHYIIRRELSANGRSRSLVNDEVVTQAELRTLASQLIDIHSQHENLLLGDDLFLIGVTDAIAGNAALREQYSADYSAYRDAEQQLHDLRRQAAQMAKDHDYLQFCYQQLADANLVADEMESLEEEAYRLSHAEQIKLDLMAAVNAMDGDEAGALMQLRACHLDDASQELAERLQSVIIELDDICSEVSRIADHTEADPERLQWIEERQDTLNSLMRKHGVQTIDELIAIRDDMGRQCERIDSFDDDIARLVKLVETTHAKVQSSADALTHSREAVCEGIGQRLICDLRQLGVQHANVAVTVSPLGEFTESGQDNVQLLFAANLNQSLHRASEIASGGEIARLMLCIKSLIANQVGLPTIILDEIDTGVSGEVATQMGRIMQTMAKARQVIAITHLPQIAALGAHHYRVYKEDTDKRTETHIKTLTDAERINEIATILSGNKPTEAAIENAKQLINPIS